MLSLGKDSNDKILVREMTNKKSNHFTFTYIVTSCPLALNNQRGLGQIPLSKLFTQIKPKVKIIPEIKIEYLLKLFPPPMVRGARRGRGGGERGANKSTHGQNSRYHQKCENCIQQIISFPCKLIKLGKIMTLH